MLESSEQQDESDRWGKIANDWQECCNQQGGDPEQPRHSHKEEDLEQRKLQEQAVDLLQQSEMRKLSLEEMGHMDTVTQGWTVLKLEEECREMQCRLWRRRFYDKNSGT